MPKLLGVTGYSGAGKTSAIEHLAARSGADRIYVGQLVADEVIAQGLLPGADSEKTVRVGLRDRFGMAGLALLVAPAIQTSFTAGRSVLIDAVCSLEELDYYRATFDAAPTLVSILASFDVRADRVAVRYEKTMTREKLLERDDLEKVVLRTDLAIEAANIKIENEAGLPELYRQLDSQVCSLIPTNHKCP
jgi:dephospho-CoA kinase